MKNTLLLLFAFISPALFAQVMTVTVDQDNFLVCPDEIVEVVAARSTTSNNSLQFDGSSDYLEIPNNAAFNIGTTSFSVEFWVLVNTTSGLEYLSVYRNATSRRRTCPSSRPTMKAGISIGESGATTSNRP